MKPSQPLRLLCSLLLLVASLAAGAQALYPTTEAPKVRAQAMIEMRGGYVSGVCVLKREGQAISGAVFNEFGISALVFTYDERRGRVKLHSVVSMLDKWYIRRTLRRDLARWMQALAQGEPTYVNARRQITYRLQPLEAAGQVEPQPTTYDTEE